MAPVPIFDGHNDALLRLHLDGVSFLDRGEFAGPEARQAGLAGGFFAVYITAPGMRPLASGAETAKMVLAAFSGEGKEPPLPDLDYSRAQAMAMMAKLFRLERESADSMAVVRTASELERAIEAGVFAVVLHFEGAEAIDPELNALEVFQKAGLRSLGIVHSRRNIFGHGVPYGFGRSPDTGPGLTDLGKELVRACNRLHVMVDLSHITEKGFWDVAELSNAPLVATHSCSHAICAATRNLTDDQLRAIGETRGMVGLNFHVGFMRPDGEVEQNTPVDVMVRHIDHMVKIAGIDSVGLGADFPYIAGPHAVASNADLPNLVEAVEKAGYQGEDLEKILYKNWIRVLRATWEPEAS